MLKILFPRPMLTAAALSLGMVIGQAAPARAQASNVSFADRLLFGVHYGGPERLSGSVSFLVLPIGKVPTSTVLEVRGRAGLGGYSVGVGPRLLLYGTVTGADALVTITRTSSSPRGAVGQSTYIGFEAGVQALARISLGVGRQIDGPSDRRDTMVIWTVGVQMPTCMWRWPSGC
jgi:hypothetical protein